MGPGSGKGLFVMRPYWNTEDSRLDSTDLGRSVHDVKIPKDLEQLDSLLYFVWEGQFMNLTLVKEFFWSSCCVNVFDFMNTLVLRIIWFSEAGSRESV